MSQHRLILAHLKRGKTINKADSIRYFRTINLGNCVHRLRNRGYNIVTTMVTANSGRKFAIYSLDK